MMSENTGTGIKEEGSDTGAEKTDRQYSDDYIDFGLSFFVLSMPVSISVGNSVSRMWNDKGIFGTVAFGCKGSIPCTSLIPGCDSDCNLLPA